MRVLLDLTKRIREVNLHAEFYHRFRSSGIPGKIILEYCVYHGCTPDAVYAIGRTILAIIEMKNYKRISAIDGEVRNTLQKQKYVALGLPLLYVRSYDHIAPCLEVLRNLSIGKGISGCDARVVAFNPFPK